MLRILQIEPIKKRELIHKTIGCCRFVYNYYLNKPIEIYQNEGKH